MKEELPVPPYWVAIVPACQVPDVMVPRVVRLVVPAHVERAVFSTFPKLRSDAEIEMSAVNAWPLTLVEVGT